MYNFTKDISQSGTIPIFNKSKVHYSRKEKEGYMSINCPIARTPVYLLLNETTQGIISKINGKKTIKDIYQDMLDEYEINDTDSIRYDISECLNQMWKNQLIRWKGDEHPYMETFSAELSDEITIRIAFDDDIAKINKFARIEKTTNNLNYICPYSNSILNNPLAIRNSIFTMTSIYVLILKQSELLGIVAFSILPNASTVATVEYMSLPENLLESVLFRSMELVKKASIVDISKVRAYIREGNPNDLNVINKCENFLKFVVTLEKEISNLNISLYEYIL